ncbi:MAG: methyltransferase domain-containing protein [Anaerolineae bacterium]|nr:methyltransferase domain-containing protein [Anaerolineae bacterium]
MNTLNRYYPLIDDWAAFETILFEPLPTCVWANPLRITAEQLAEIFTTEGIDFEPLAWQPGGFQLAPDFKPGHHWAFLAGLYHSQEAVSMLPVLLLDPQPGERVLDLCAAPGNKTAQIAVQMGNRGTVVANDINAGRMRAARQTFERLGLLNVTTTTADGGNYPPAAGLFDKVLVDVPCSCEGTTRKEPIIVERIGEAISCKKSGSQKALLRKAVQLCKPGGRIVYATCTYAPEENELVVDAILRQHTSVRIVEADIAGLKMSPGITTWQGQALDPSLHLCRRVWPHHNNTGGFFIAVLEKEGQFPPLPQGEGSRVSDGVRAFLHDDLPPETDAMLQTALQRHGLQLDDLHPNIVFQPSRWRVYLTNPDHQPLTAPEPEAEGMIFLNIKSKYPKLSTAAAQWIDRKATQNTLDLDESQTRAYLNRERFDITAAPGHLTGRGYILVRYRGFGLGVALYYPHQDKLGGVIESLFPKGWSPVKT